MATPHEQIVNLVIGSLPTGKIDGGKLRELASAAKAERDDAALDCRLQKAIRELQFTAKAFKGQRLLDAVRRRLAEFDNN